MNTLTKQQQTSRDAAIVRRALGPIAPAAPVKPANWSQAQFAMGAL